MKYIVCNAPIPITYIFVTTTTLRVLSDVYLLINISASWSKWFEISALSVGGN